MINKLLAEQSSSRSTFVYTGGQLNWPVPSRSPSSSSLSSGYVNRNRPIGTGREFHTGYDIPAGYGSAVCAAEAGTVIYSGWMSGYGNTIMINHGNGLVTLYGHNSSLTVSKGDTVTRGQQVAKIGSTGNSTGNHCHFEVRVNGSHTNPEPYLGVPNISS
ncbi:murein hydrolase activator EnvC [Clostridiales bacterium]|nr:murein hydrolase activator EnvC [Clostridiales bacterium]